MKKPKRLSFKQKVLRQNPDAFCVKLNDGTGFIVWPGKIQPRGFERPALSTGKTVHAAWKNAMIALFPKFITNT